MDVEIGSKNETVVKKSFGLLVRHDQGAVVGLIEWRRLDTFALRDTSDINEPDRPLESRRVPLSTHEKDTTPRVRERSEEIDDLSSGDVDILACQCLLKALSGRARGVFLASGEIVENCLE